MKERNHTFDFLSGLCIIRVIMLHCISMCGLRNTFWFSKLMAWTFFVLNFFFFKAGYFNHTTGGPTRHFLKDKGRKLLIPYVAWGVIGSVVFFGFLLAFPAETASLRKTLRWDHLWRQSHFYGNPPIWFLTSFFCAYFVVLLMHKVKGLGWICFVFPAISWWLAQKGNPLWMSLNNVFVGVYFFQLGRLWRWIQAHVPTTWFWCWSVCMVGGFVIGNHFLHGEYDMSLNKWVQNPVGAMLNSSLALMGLSGTLLPFVKRRVPLIGYVGEYSMVFFVLHYPLLHYYRLVHLAAGRSMFRRWDDFILVTLAILGICSWLSPYIHRIPWLSGNWPKDTPQPDMHTAVKQPINITQ